MPKISDVAILREVMGDIGFEVRRRERRALEIRAGEAAWPFVPLEAAIKMRASFILLGPMLARFGRVILPNPGGDRIGRRPVDIHVAAMEPIGATSSTATATTSPRRHRAAFGAPRSSSRA